MVRHMLIHTGEAAAEIVHHLAGRAWECEGERGRLTLAEAMGAVEDADRWLAVNLYEPRWDRLDAVGHLPLRGPRRRPRRMAP